MNVLPPEDRLSRRWAYLLLTDADFYTYRANGGTFADLCTLAELTATGLKGEFDFGV